MYFYRVYGYFWRVCASLQYIICVIVILVRGGNPSASYVTGRLRDDRKYSALPPKSYAQWILDREKKSQGTCGEIFARDIINRYIHYNIYSYARMYTG